MDVFESEARSQKHVKVNIPRRPLLPTDKNNAVSSVRNGTGEINCRYKSSPARGRSPSPNRAPPQLLSKREISADRNRPSTPSRPSTPARDSSVTMEQPCTRLSTCQFPEALWPSTMRSLSVSFQTDTISIPVSKKGKEKPATNISLDRSLRTPNVSHKQLPETPASFRKPTPDRKRSPMKGKSAPDVTESENAKPIHCKTSSRQLLGVGFSVAGKPPVPGKPLPKAPSDTAKLFSLDDFISLGSEVKASSNNNLVQLPRATSRISLNYSDRKVPLNPILRSQPLPTAGFRSPSPRRTPSFSVTGSTGVSPSHSRPATPPSRAASPSRITVSTSLYSQSSNATLVLSFVADIKKGKRSATYIEDAHYLRLLYNRYLQWRFANARAMSVLHIQKLIAEEKLFIVWNANLRLWDSVIDKRVNLQKLKLELKLNEVLKDQMSCLNDWALMERDHISSLSGAVEDLEASTLRLPVVGGAKVDKKSLQAALFSSANVMQTIGTAIGSFVSKVEDLDNLISELMIVVAQERRLLDQCEALLDSKTALQVQERSLRSHLMQNNET